MVGSLARRERRPAWVVVSLVFAAAIGVALWAAAHAREVATIRATNEARITAQTKLAPLLDPGDLIDVVVGDRAAELAAAIERYVTSGGPIDEVRIYSASGRILYAEDPAIVGTRPTYVRTVTFEVANGTARSWVRAGLLQTHVPIWLSPGGTVAVAEMSEPFGPIASAAKGPWYQMALAFGALMLVAIAMVVVTTYFNVSPAPVRGPELAASDRSPRARRSEADGPAQDRHDLRTLQERQREAEARAASAEENFRAVQKQLRNALDQIKEMEARLTMSETQTTQSDGELQALREQLRDTAERLHKAELDNNALRERLALRQQELDVARAPSTTGSPEDTGALRSRLEAAERRAAELAEAVERLEAELDYTKGRFHLSRLTDALREIDNDDIQIEERDGSRDSLIVRRSSLQPGKVG